jgi:hypothetical protein
MICSSGRASPTAISGSTSRTTRRTPAINEVGSTSILIKSARVGRLRHQYGM